MLCRRFVGFRTTRLLTSTLRAFFERAVATACGGRIVELVLALFLYVCFSCLCFGGRRSWDLPQSKTVGVVIFRSVTLSEPSLRMVVLLCIVYVI